MKINGGSLIVTLLLFHIFLLLDDFCAALITILPPDDHPHILHVKKIDKNAFISYHHFLFVIFNYNVDHDHEAIEMLAL